MDDTPAADFLRWYAAQTWADAPATHGSTGRILTTGDGERVVKLQWCVRADGLFAAQVYRSHAELGARMDAALEAAAMDVGAAETAETAEAAEAAEAAGAAGAVVSADDLRALHDARSHDVEREIDAMLLAGNAGVSPHVVDVVISPMAEILGAPVWISAIVQENGGDTIFNTAPDGLCDLIFGPPRLIAAIGRTFTRAAAAGLVHLDPNPGNILTDGRLIDWGQYDRVNTSRPGHALKGVLVMAERFYSANVGRRAWFEKSMFDYSTDARVLMARDAIPAVRRMVSNARLACTPRLSARKSLVTSRPRAPSAPSTVSSSLANPRGGSNPG
jgi:hypothetical protein